MRDAQQSLTALTAQDVSATIPTSTPASATSSGYVQRELSEFLQFMKRPRRGTGKQAVGWGWLWRVLFFFALLLVLYVPLSLALTWGQGFVALNSKLDLSGSPLEVLLTMALFAPVIEELIFRAGLRSFSYSVFAGPVVIGLSLLNTASIFPILGIAAVSFGFWVIRLRKLEADPRANRQFSRQFLNLYPRIFWIYAIGFGLLHIGNYEIGGWGAALAVALFQLPQMLGGVAMGYLRLRDGLRSSIALHVFNNLLAVWLALHADQCPNWIRFMCE